MYKDIKIVYEAGIEEKIESILKKRCIKRYVKLPNIYAIWGEHMKHLNSHVWPGTDSVILLIATSEESAIISQELKELKEELINGNVNAPFIATFTTIDEVIENGVMDCDV